MEKTTYADVSDEASVGRALEGCDAAVNAVGLYVERGDETFRAIHELGAMHVARLSYLSVQGAHRTSCSGKPAGLTCSYRCPLLSGKPWRGC